MAESTSLTQTILSRLLDPPRPNDPRHLEPHHILAGDFASLSPAEQRDFLDACARAIPTLPESGKFDAVRYALINLLAMGPGLLSSEVTQPLIMVLSNELLRDRYYGERNLEYALISVLVATSESERVLAFLATASPYRKSREFDCLALEVATGVDSRRFLAFLEQLVPWLDAPLPQLPLLLELALFRRGAGDFCQWWLDRVPLLEPSYSVGIARVREELIGLLSGSSDTEDDWGPEGMLLFTVLLEANIGPDEIRDITELASKGHLRTDDVIRVVARAQEFALSRTGAPAIYLPDPRIVGPLLSERDEHTRFLTLRGVGAFTEQEKSHISILLSALESEMHVGLRLSEHHE